MAEELRWAILGTGVIARQFAEELAHSHHGRLVAVGSRDQATADVFAARFGPDRAHGGYQALLEDEGVDAVYIATPHPSHARWAIRALEAGRHVLCEKPVALNQADAEAIIDAAGASGRFFMEAFMYRCHPQTRRLLEVVRSGVLGRLCVIEAVHSFRGSSDPDGRLLDPALGGGGILDVGCYCVSGARLLAGVGTGRAGAIEPTAVAGRAHLGPTRVDEWAVATLEFPGGVLAHLATGVQVDQPPALRLHGTEATVELDQPWLPGRAGRRDHSFVIRRAGQEPEVVSVTSDRGMYAIEADEVAECIGRGATESDAMSWRDTVGNMETLDRWRQGVGLTYDAERPTSLVEPVRGGPLRVAPVTIARRTVDGVGKDLSRVVLGTMLALGDPSWPTAMAVFDAFFERGGNTFDSARRYGRGESDRALGHWMESRGVRSETVVVAKGAHTPHCDPDSLTRELEQSLQDLRTDHADLYLLHRDNPAVPVGEFVDVLDRHRRAGRIRAFGGSNWTMARIDEANQYAERHGMAGFRALSNNFSLARMVRPTFPGCLSASDPEWRPWLAARRLAVLAWSSQAAGWFAGVDQGRQARAWDDPGNRERRARAEQLGARLGCSANTVALAWVLAQPLPIFPIIGPRNLAELRSSLRALDLDLDPDQRAWLDLETGGGGTSVG